MKDAKQTATDAIQEINDYTELFDLNKLIIARFNYIRDMRNVEAQQKFHKDQEVEWEDNDGRTHHGNIIRRNKKTLTIIEESFGSTVKWNVS